MTAIASVNDRSPHGALAPPVTQREFSGPVEQLVRRRALVVDDEPLIRWSVGETLAALGLDVTESGDAASALESIAAAPAPFDVVVLDLRLPDVDDLSLVSRVRSQLPAAAVVLMTAFGTPEIVAGACALGVAGILYKPFELDELSRLLASAGGAPTS